MGWLVKSRRRHAAGEAAAGHAQHGSSVLLVQCKDKGLPLFALLMLVLLKLPPRMAFISMHEPVPASQPGQLWDLVCCLQDRLVVQPAANTDPAL